jgi:hypothetical protein
MKKKSQKEYKTRVGRHNNKRKENRYTKLVIVTKTVKIKTDRHNKKREENRYTKLVIVTKTVKVKIIIPKYGPITQFTHILLLMFLFLSLDHILYYLKFSLELIIIIFNNFLWHIQIDIFAIRIE